MKAHDELLWTSGRAKVAAGQRLTDAETEVLKFYGGAAALRQGFTLLLAANCAIQRLTSGRRGIAFITSFPRA